MGKHCPPDTAPWPVTAQRPPYRWSARRPPHHHPQLRLVCPRCSDDRKKRRGTPQQQLNEAIKLNSDLERVCASTLSTWHLDGSADILHASFIEYYCHGVLQDRSSARREGAGGSYEAKPCGVRHNPPSGAHCRNTCRPDARWRPAGKCRWRRRKRGC